MNYSKLSDDEINAAVECELDERFRFMEFDEKAGEFIYCDPTGENCQRIKPRDYCNNPSDAWPIIFENEIRLDPRRTFKKLPWMADGGCNQIYWCDKNPLRAAMIVYLMMQEQK